MRTIRNVHQRTIEAPTETVGTLLDQLGSDTDPLWPAPAWVPMRLDRPLALGVGGGHGPIRYRVSEYEPGRRVRFTFHPQMGINGHHEFTVVPQGSDRCLLRHVVAARPRGRMRLLWPIAIRWLHDAVLEDLLDNAERVATGQVVRPARWSRWVRLLRSMEFPGPRPAPIPEAARLARATFDRTDFADAWQVRYIRGMSTDPQVWADELFRDPPHWVKVLLAVRQGLVGLVGIERAGTGTFDTVATGHGEVLLGADAGDLDFRASVLVEARAVTVTTVVRTHNRRGRAYLALVRRVHPLVVRGMLRRATRRLSERGPNLPHPARTGDPTAVGEGSPPHDPAHQLESEPPDPRRTRRPAPTLPGWHGR